MHRYNSYIICANPRSGSTLLCKLLTDTRVAGKPESYFHLPSLSKWAEDCGVPFKGSQVNVMAAVLDQVLHKGTNGTNVFGLRLMRKSFDYLMAQLAAQYPDLPNDTARFNAAFGRTLFIRLTRGDKIAQTVSVVKAMQTGLWHAAPDGREIERTAPPKLPVYDVDLITRELAELTGFDQDWQRWFSREKITPFAVNYEALSDNPSAVLADILRQLGLDPAAANGARPQVAKLADATSRDWIARYRAERDNT
ncbi:MAG: Stf0 family sulfotransferase [Paracoccaceae bacterium]